MTILSKRLINILYELYNGKISSLFEWKRILIKEKFFETCFMK